MKSDAPTYTAPGPGSWQLETAHYPRPLTRFIADPTLKAIRRAWGEGTARYGLLFDSFEPAMVNDFLYCQPVPVVGKRGSSLPPRSVFRLLTALHPVLRHRITQSSRALEDRVWRGELRTWDEVTKPQAIATHLALQAIDPDALDDGALERHLVTLRDNFEEMILAHHRFALPCGLPLGDFLAVAGEWTGKSVAELLPLLNGSSPISLGIAAAELDTLGAALRERPEVAEALFAGPPTLTSLRALEDVDGAVGVAARAYLELVGYRSLGYDIGDRYALELPEMLVRAIRVATHASGRKAADEKSVAARTSAVRAEVPAKHRATFDALLAEARVTNRLRDERGVYTDCWAAGLARRAVLSAGRRLVQKGILEDAELAVDATCEELVALLRGNASPTVDDLRGRARWRTTHTVADAPKHLGPAPQLPPAEWMPVSARRAARAFSTWLFTMIDDQEATPPKASLVGLAASPGVYEGIARLALGPGDFASIQSGDVLVTLSTSPTFNVVLPLLGGIVTDRGGQLSHAAIVAREYGIPCVVGTRDATARIESGMRIRVDGALGEVTVLG